jgi:hypothetical protein
MGVLFILPIIYEYGEPRWNYTDREHWEKTMSQRHFVHHMD